MRFLHDDDAQNDIKIQMLEHRHGFGGYGRFWRLVEMLSKNGGTLNTGHAHFFPMLAKRLDMHEADAQVFVRDCVDIGLFRAENGTLISDRLVRDRVAYEHTKEQRKKAALTRWDKEKKDLTIFPCKEERRDKYREEKDKRIIARWEAEKKQEK